jgi:hypothetical protein
MARPIQSYLDTLIAHHMPELSGAEFKIAVYLWRQLQHRTEIATDIDTVAKATGVSWRQSQFALRSLDRKGILRLESRKKVGTLCSIPGEKGRSKAQSDTSRSKTTRRPRPVRRSSPVPQAHAPTGSGSARSKLSLASAPAPEAVKVQPTVALASPSPQELELAAKGDQARRLASTLMDLRPLITREDFSMLLQCADGELDRLLARLRKLIQQGSRFDSSRHLGAEVRRMVLVR